MRALSSVFLEGAQDEERSDAGHEADDNSPASRVRQRYERMFRDRDNAEMLSDDAARAADAAREAANAAARTAFHGSIATVFTKHLRQAPPTVETIRLAVKKYSCAACHGSKHMICTLACQSVIHLDCHAPAWPS